MLRDLLKTNLFVMKNTVSIHIISVILLIFPMAEKLLYIICDSKGVANYESTYIIVMCALILVIGFYMQKMISSKILNLEITNHARKKVFSMLLVTVEIYCTCVIMLYYLIYSVCFACLDLFLKSFYLIIIIYIPIIALIFCIGYMINNYIVSSAISWLLCCLDYINIYFFIDNEFLNSVSPLIWLRKCCGGITNFKEVGEYILVVFVFMSFFLLISNSVIKRIEYK